MDPRGVSDGTPAVLKIPNLDEENRPEADPLRLYAGDGAVLLYEADSRTGGLLLERLEPGTPLADHPDREAAIDIVCGLRRRPWRPPPLVHGWGLVRAVESALWSLDVGEDPTEDLARAAALSESR